MGGRIVINENCLYKYQGTRGEIKRKYIKELISQERPDMICIQETKLGKLNIERCYSLWGG